ADGRFEAGAWMILDGKGRALLGDALRKVSGLLGLGALTRELECLLAHPSRFGDLVGEGMVLFPGLHRAFPGGLDRVRDPLGRKFALRRGVERSYESGSCLVPVTDLARDHAQGELDLRPRRRGARGPTASIGDRAALSAGLPEVRGPALLGQALFK